MKTLFKGIGLILALTAGTAQAIPTLFFDGQLNYDATAGTLTVNSVLTNTTDLAMPSLTGGTLNFTAKFTHRFSNSSITVGQFGTTSGTDLSASNSSNTLLTGNFSNLLLGGHNGNDFGGLTASMSSTGGLFASQFSTGQMLTLVFNTQLNGQAFDFNPRMFTTNFNGHIDGRLEGQSVNVPEPPIMALLGIGLVLGIVLPGMRKKQ